MFGFMYRLFENADRPRLLDKQVDELVFRIGPWGIAAMVLSIILWAALVTLLVLLIVYFIKQVKHYPTTQLGRLSGSSGAGRSHPGSFSTPSAAGSPVSAEALRLLDERYARGEMGHDEYLTRRNNLLGAGVPGAGAPVGAGVSSAAPQSAGTPSQPETGEPSSPSSI
ncbi:MAG: SHOCT domain-containing protein [Thermoleophilia bacterium]|nr:SHOCT domain-containing protein [Thermoleophilia bacterium]